MSDPAAPHALPGLARHSYLFAPAPYTVRDALYGGVPLSEAAYRTLDTRLFQRLKHLKQVGPVYLVYPGATHTRFSHCIGVYHLVRLALQHLTTLADFEPEAGRATLAAALLHDLGHFPYSHVMDDIAINGRSLSHLELSVSLIETDAEVRSVLQDYWEVDPLLVADILARRPNPRVPAFLYTLIDGPMDMDKLDYLNRDAHHTGVPYGRVEVQRLIEFLAVDPASGDLVITEAGVGTVESVIFAKYLMFRYVYWHHAARIAGAMFNRAVLDCFLALGVQTLTVADPLVRRVCLSTDATIDAILRALLVEADTAPPPSLELLARVEERRLYKRAASVPCADAPQRAEQYRDALARRAREGEIAQAMSVALGPGAAPVQHHQVLIDLPPTDKFAADVRGIAIEDEHAGARVVPWEQAPRPSYLSAATVAAMEQHIRFILYLYDPGHPQAGSLRDALRGHPQVL
ncbi:MAG: HD domain-containing protein [Chloroflexi bacterium]|nr:HD domain-containing protein [Chloroflexota bacterium]